MQGAWYALGEVRKMKNSNDISYLRQDSKESENFNKTSLILNDTLPQTFSILPKETNFYQKSNDFLKKT